MKNKWYVLSFWSRFACILGLFNSVILKMDACFLFDWIKCCCDRKSDRAATDSFKAFQQSSYDFLYALKNPDILRERYDYWIAECMKLEVSRKAELHQTIINELLQEEGLVQNINYYKKNDIKHFLSIAREYLEHVILEFPLDFIHVIIEKTYKNVILLEIEEEDVRKEFYKGELRKNLIARRFYSSCELILQHLSMFCQYLADTVDIERLDEEADNDNGSIEEEAKRSLKNTLLKLITQLNFFMKMDVVLKSKGA